MSNLPLISVIVPVYNTEAYLRKCLDSICEQTYPHLEILCVNDGSTDGSADILSEFAAKDKRIKIINQQNAGLSAARNAALDIAQGEWITGVDSDDYLEKNAYEYALQNANDEVDVICFGTRVIWEREEEMNDDFQQYFRFAYNGVQDVTEDLIRKTNVTFWSKLWRRDLIERFALRFPVGLWYEDNYFYFTLAPFARKIAFLPEEKINYLQRRGSITSHKEHPKVYDKLRIAAAIEFFYIQHPLPHHLKKVALYAFEDCFYCGYVQATSETYRINFLKMASRIANSCDLIKQYPQRIRFLKKIPWYLKLFIKHTLRKSYYGLPGIPVLTISRRNKEEIIRLFGIKINKKQILC